MASEFISTALTQLWQISLLILAVAGLTRWISPRRPHLSHLLWLVVLIKCVTPPLWSSSGGVFCWLQPEQQVITTSTEDMEWEPIAWDGLLEVDAEAVSSSGKSAPFAGVYLDESAEHDVQDLESHANSQSSTSSINWQWLTVLSLWLTVSVLVAAVVTVRWWRFWKLVRTSRQRESPELVEMIRTLSRTLGIRRQIRLIVTESLTGPAVVGFFRVTVLIPAVVADRLPGSAIKSILAHELLHVRRGDVWVGLLQTIAQALWWFNPLVWWAGRATSREAERCCDEEVLGELRCDPASYARTLLDVLDLKSQLTPVPVFPGVRPVDVTSQRLERIMLLRQGCRRRSPWWCWLVAIGVAVLTLPGAAFVVTAQGQQPQDVFQNPVPSEIPERTGLPDASPAQQLLLQRTPRLNVLTPAHHSNAHHSDTHQTVAYDVGDFSHLLTGTEDERQQKFERLVHSRQHAANASIHWFEGRPVVKATNAGHLAVRQCLSLFAETETSPATFDEFLNSVTKHPETALICKIRMVTADEDACSALEDAVRQSVSEHDKSGPWVISAEQWEAARHSVPSDHAFLFSAPQIALVNGSPAQIESITQSPVNLNRDKAGHQAETNWSGWKVSLLPFLRNDGSFWLGMRMRFGTVAETEKLNEEQFLKFSQAEPVTTHTYRDFQVATKLKPHEVIVLPGFTSTHGNGPGRSMIMTATIRRLSDQSETAPDLSSTQPSPQHIAGTGVNSDAGVTGEIILQPRSAAKARQTVPAARQEGSQNDRTNDAGGTTTQNQPGHNGEGPRITRRAFGPLFLTVRKHRDGTENPRLLMLLEDADGNDVLAGAMNNIQINSTKLAETVEISDARLKTVGDSDHHFVAKRIRLIADRGEHPGKTLRMELESAGVEFSSGGRSSKLVAEQIEMMLNVDPFAVEQVKAERLGTLKSGHPVQMRDQPRASPNESDSIKPTVARDTNARDAARKILDQPVAIGFSNTPLDEVIETLAKLLQLNMVLDTRGLEEEGVLSNALVSIDVSGITLRSALQVLLDPLNLATFITDDGVVVVTGRQHARGPLITAVYAVADLVVPIPSNVSVHLGEDVTHLADHPESTDVAADPKTRRREGQRVATPLPATNKTTDFDFEQLIELIQQTVEPDSWSEVGGVGRIVANETTLSLVVRQTKEVHEEISDLLQQLRRLQDIQVTLRLESLTVPEGLQTDGTIDLQFKPLGDSKTHRFARLTADQAKRLRNGSEIKPAPKITLLNGQYCELVLARQPGQPTRLMLRPVVSGDRRFVRLSLGTSDADSENTRDRPIAALPAIPSGESVLVKLPGATNRSNDHRFLLIQPQVIIAEEEQELLGIDSN